MTERPIAKEWQEIEDDWDEEEKIWQDERRKQHLRF